MKDRRRCPPHSFVAPSTAAWLAPLLAATLGCGAEPAGGGQTAAADDSTSGTTADATTASSGTTAAAASSGEPTGPDATASGDDDDATSGPSPTDGGDATSGDSGDSGDTGDTGEVYPEPDWEPGLPEDHGLSGRGLAAMAAVAEQSDSNCLLVTQGGIVVGEWYWNNFGPEVDQDNVYSVTKSITSALVGIAVERGELDVEAPAGFTEWKGGASEGVLLRNLISNDSGRAWTFNSDYVQMGIQPDQTQYAIDLGQDKPPGTWWEYNNAAIQTTERALALATGANVGDYAQERLFEKIHMTAKMGHDGEGNALTYQGVSASCRDLARLGYLYLRGGRWAGGVQVVPEWWVAETITPSTALNSAYGFMWWLNRPGHWVLPSAPLRTEGDGKLIAAAPDEIFMAVGAFGQYVVVDPTSDSVWVRLGPLDLVDTTGFGKLKDLWAAFAAAQLP